VSSIQLYTYLYGDLDTKFERWLALIALVAITAIR
jgi:hypothetical protein